MAQDAMRPIEPALMIQHLQQENARLAAELRHERILRHQRAEPILCAVIDALNGLAQTPSADAQRLLRQFYEAFDGGREQLGRIRVPTEAEARQLQG